MRLELYFQPSLDLTFLGAPFPTPPIVILQFENGTQAVTVPELGTCTLQLFTLSWIHRDWVQDFLIKALIDDLNWVTCLQYNTSWFHSQGSTFAAEYYASYGDYMGIPVQVDVFTPSASAHRAPTLLIAGKVMKYKPGVTAPDDAYAVPNGCQEPSDGSSMLDALQQWLTLRRHGNLFAEGPRTLGNMSIQNLSCLA